MGSSPQKKSVTRLARWVSRASGLWSPMVSDHEHIWGHWGRVGVTPPMVSDHERNWGPSDGCHALRGLWSPMVSDHEHNWGQHEPGVSRARAFDLPWSPIMSTIGGPVVFPRTVWGAFVRKKVPRDWLDGWRALGSVVSHGLLMSAMGPGGCHAVHGFQGLRSDRGWEGVTRLGPWSPMVSAHERNGPGP